MKNFLWKTAVFLITLLLVVGCGTSQAEPDTEALPEITGPAFLLFYTDN